MYSAFKNITLKEIIEADYVIKNEFIKEAGQKIKVDEFESQKEDNIDMAIDLYGSDKMLFSQFESRFYEVKLHNMYIRNNHFLLKCKLCHKLFANGKFSQSKILRCAKSTSQFGLH